MRTALSLVLAASLVSATPVGAQAPTSDWSRVVAIASGTAVVMTVRGSKPDKRRIVQADQSTVTVVSLSTQVVEAIARGDVLEIRTEGVPSNKRRALGLLAGLGGAIGGTFVGASVGETVGGCEAENLACMSVGMMTGVVGGAVLGYRVVTRTKGDLIYRVP